MTVLVAVRSLLGASRRRRLLALLDSPALRWELSAALGRTASGPMWQLADRESHRTPAMRELAGVLATVVHEAVRSRLPQLLPPADELEPQVFPVRMAGSSTDPPTQWPHRDGVAGRRPLVTALYYPLVDRTAGGTLRLHAESGDVVAEHVPGEDDLVVIRGDQLHSVGPLVAGRRVTVVVNFYRPEGSAS